MTPLILDGSNLCHEGQKKGGKFNTLGALLPCLRALLDNGIEAYVIFDASFRWRLEKGSKAAEEFETLLDKDERFRMAPAGTPADVFILELAALRGFGVLSNDAFREYVERKGKGREPLFHGKKIQLHSFQMFAGVFVIPSLGIRCLIDDKALDVDEIIAARTGESQPPGKPATRAPARAAASGKAGRAAPAKPAAGRPAPDGPDPDASANAPRLDFLLKLSPFCLRARDLFEVHRQLTGKPWTPGISKKTAADFGRECLARNIVYAEPADRKANDGYFFDARYSEDRHTAVRSYLLKECPRMLPLMASARGRLLPLLDLIHDKQLAKGFDFQQLCDRADALNLSYYRNYLHCLLYALIAADGVCGADPKETDILVILKGEMQVTSDESRSDRLNFLQRGILYLLAGPDNVLPELVGNNLGWMLQLPKDEKVMRGIVDAHLEWLAPDEA
jgi:hypothetical protein